MTYKVLWELWPPASQGVVFPPHLDSKSTLPQRQAGCGCRAHLLPYVSLSSNVLQPSHLGCPSSLASFGLLGQESPSLPPPPPAPPSKLPRLHFPHICVCCQPTCTPNRGRGVTVTTWNWQCSQCVVDTHARARRVFGKGATNEEFGGRQAGDTARPGGGGSDPPAAPPRERFPVGGRTPAGDF